MSEHTPEPIELPDNWPTHREAMLAGKLYNPADTELVQLRERSADLCWQFNMTRPTDHTTRAAVLHQLLGAYGKDCELLGPIQFDYGCFTTLGDRVFINYNCTVIGAGAVVTHDIPPHSLAVGVPAKVIRAIDDRDDASALHEYAQLQ